ncbi:MAG: DUF3592 domain-containing protein [Planctomycetes bacterium]|nr:DUF3592 domain-containing protein [Planctomycetota bacterium]
MKVVRILGAIFLAVALILFLVAGLVYNHTKKFMETSVTTTGTVTDFELRRSSSSSSSSSGVYYPLVEFKTDKGETVEFVSSCGSRPAAYDKGESVTVRYDPGSTKYPYRARIDTFASNWLGVIIPGALGAAFAVAAVIMLTASILSGRTERWLLDFGQPTMTEFQRVEVNTSVRMNGRSPYRIISQWENPATGEVHVFYSKNIWFNPEQYITGSEVRVLIDPNNPKTYLMDTSFLPERAE